LFRYWIEQRLTSRLRLVQWARAHPEEAAGPIEQPLVVTGLARSGTTYLHELLAAVPATRVVRKWEAEDPVPPPEATTPGPDPRIAKCVEATEAMYSFVPGLRMAHYERGDGPIECRVLIGMAFRAADFPVVFTIPSYTSWRLGADLRPGYAIHRLALGVLQSRARGPWVLKDPSHLLALDDLFGAYPDARVVVLHRDPCEAVPSLAALSASAADVLRETPAPPAYWGAQYLQTLGASADRLVAARTHLPGERFLDLAYADLLADPVGTVAAIQAFARRDFDGPAREAVRAATVNFPQHKFGVHRYSLAAFGLSAAAVRERFDPYRTAFADYLRRPAQP
jgi:energy-converting hydrogenase Eha subunit C